MDSQPKQYPVRLVGEQHYRQACEACRPGERVDILFEDGNPYDDMALVAKNSRGQTIGYIARDNFVQGVYHEQDRRVDARITGKTWENGQWQIELAVQVIDEPGDTVDYAGAALSSSDDDTADDQTGAGAGAQLAVGAAVIAILFAIIWLM